MSLVNIFTPKDTEEIKPGLFVQKKGKNYRVINPIAWNGVIDWKTQLKSIFSIRTIFTIAIVLFLVWSYQNDVGQYQQFYYEIHEDPMGFCDNMYEILNTDYCTQEAHDKGLCVMTKYFEDGIDENLFNDIIISN